MKQLNMRFDAKLLKSWIGSNFQKYQCDAFDFTNSVTQIAELFIGGKIYALTNIQETVDYYGNNEDISVFKLHIAQKDDIHSAFEDTQQIVTPIDGKIEKILLVNENQTISVQQKLTYDVWLTRGLIFFVDGREISFEKDSVPFSEEIIINRGYNLLQKFSDEKDFLDGWDKGITPECHRQVIELK